MCYLSLSRNFVPIYIWQMCSDIIGMLSVVDVHDQNNTSAEMWTRVRVYTHANMTYKHTRTHAHTHTCTHAHTQHRLCLSLTHTRDPEFYSAHFHNIINNAIQLSDCGNCPQQNKTSSIKTCMRTPNHATCHRLVHSLTHARTHTCTYTHTHTCRLDTREISTSVSVHMRLSACVSACADTWAHWL